MRWQNAYPFVKYGIFNAEQDPVNQGYAAHSFDAIVAVNVLHATSDLYQTLSNTHRLIRPGGVLVLSEVTEVSDTTVADMTWGLTEGWWLFSDGRQYAPQSRSQWAEWFRKTNFDGTGMAMQPDVSGTHAITGQTVFVVKALCQREFNGGRMLAQPQVSSQQAYLVTGGLGGVGIITAQWLLDSCGKSSLMLSSRSGSVKDRADGTKLNVLQARDASIATCACDIAQLDSIGSLLHTPDYTPLGGVIHSVGVLVDGLIANQTAASFVKVVSPKAQGAHHLHALLQHQALEAFVVYSSFAGVIGSPGQSPHSAANTAMDSLAQQRQGLGQHTLVLQWGAWSQIGYAARVGADLRADVTSFTPQMGIYALQSVWSMSLTATVTWIAADFSLGLPGSVHLLQGIKQVSTAQLQLLPKETKSLNTNTHDLPDSLSDMSKLSKDGQKDALLAMVSSKVADAAGIQVTTLEPLMDAGVDSLMAIELRNLLSESVGIGLASGVLFDYPTADKLASHIQSIVFGDANISQIIMADKTFSQGPLHIAGTSCALAGDSNSSSKFWRVLHRGVALIQDSPGRWDEAAYADTGQAASKGKCYIQSGGYVSAVEQFDPKFFQISPAEAALMEPQQRNLLEVNHVCDFLTCCIIHI